MTVGEALSEARSRAGLSVDQLSERTKIRERVISGIERDDYEACGGNLFVRGYIRVMADALGIDAQPLIQEYDEAHQSERMSVPSPRPLSEDSESADLPEPGDAAEPGDAPEPESTPASGAGAEFPHVFGAAASGVLTANAAAAAAEAPPPARALDDPEATSVDLPPVPDAPESEAEDEPEPAEEAPHREEPFDVFARSAPAETSPASAPNDTRTDLPAITDPPAITDLSPTPEVTRTDLSPVEPEPAPEPESAEPESAAERESAAEPDLESTAALPVAAAAAAPKPRPAAGLTSTSASPRLQSGPPVLFSSSGGDGSDGGDGGDDGGRDPRRRRKGLLIGAAALIVVAGAVVGGTRAFGGGGSNSAANAAGVSAQRASASASGATTNGNTNANGSAKAGQASPSAPTVKKLAMEPPSNSKHSQGSLTEVPVQFAEAFGPDGTSDGDNPDTANNPVSTSSDAPWSTDWYATAQFGGLETGTGLLLDLGSKANVTRLALDLGQPSGAGIELLTGNAPDLKDLTVVASGENIGGDVVLNVTKPAKVRYLLIWFTTLPPATSTESASTASTGSTSATDTSDSGSGRFQASIYDIAVAARS